MPRPLIATRIEEARRDRGQDRISVIEARNRTLIVVADGAGGVAGGADAADLICGALTQATDQWSTWLEQRDVILSEKSVGLAAAVVGTTEASMVVVATLRAS